ncbi:uncharacterized protein LOC135257909 [Anguilla rostrata]|uniref:uncharacterized protein LOC135257909 n=1 Tax=Anguilla rostrata TaxID=7938 RepID=UPI0030CEA66F
MPFGLMNAPAVFQALVNDVLRVLLNRSVVVYLDDILIFSQNPQDHVSHVRKVLQQLLENKLFVKVEKCEFHVSSVRFLGFIIEEGQVRMDPEKVKVVIEWPTPTTLKHLQRFLGFANFYRRFIRDYSRVVAPLTHLTSSSVAFAWTPEADTAFTDLKRRFSSAPILIHPDPVRQFVVEVDASETGGGAVLSQRSVSDNKLHPCAFFSRKFSPAERNYDAGDRELLAIKMALEEWRHWFEGTEQPFLVWTDHKNLPYLQSAKRVNSRQARWALFFGRFNFTISYRPESKNTKPDALSRQFSKGGRPAEPEPILPSACVVAAVTWEIEEAIKRAQQDQPDPRPDPNSAIFVPKSVHSQVLQWAHSTRLTCHPAHPIPPKAKLLVGIHGSGCNTVILTIVDRFSKAVHFVPLPKLPTARETADLLVAQVVRLHGIPADIVSDRGPQFTSQVTSHHSSWPRRRRLLFRPSKPTSSDATRSGRTPTLRNQRLADRHRTPAPDYQPGQEVWLSTRDIPLQVESKKLQPCYIGPFKIARIINPSAVQLPPQFQPPDPARPSPASQSPAQLPHRHRRYSVQRQAGFQISPQNLTALLQACLGSCHSLFRATPSRIPDLCTYPHGSCPKSALVPTALYFYPKPVSQDYKTGPDLAEDKEETWLVESGDQVLLKTNQPIQIRDI